MYESHTASALKNEAGWLNQKAVVEGSKTLTSLHCGLEAPFHLPRPPTRSAKCTQGTVMSARCDVPAREDSDSVGHDPEVYLHYYLHLDYSHHDCVKLSQWPSICKLWSARDLQGPLYQPGQQSRPDRPRLKPLNQLESRVSS